MLHKDITSANAHLIGYVQASDPGAVGAGKVWIDTTAGTGSWILYIRNDADDGWESPEAQTAAAHTHTESEITDLDHTDTDAFHKTPANEISDLDPIVDMESTDSILVEDADDGLLYTMTLGDIFDFDAFHKTASNDLTALTEKTGPEAGDYILVQDQDDDAWKKVDIANITTGEAASEIWATAIPHYSRGTGTFTVTCIGTHVFAGTMPATAKVTARDLIHCLKGGVASPTYAYDIKIWDGGSYGGTDPDPSVPYIDVGYDDGPQVLVVIKASDGTTTVETTCYVVVDGESAP